MRIAFTASQTISGTAHLCSVYSHINLLGHYWPRSRFITCLPPCAAWACCGSRLIPDDRCHVPLGTAPARDHISHKQSLVLASVLCLGTLWHHPLKLVCQPNDLYSWPSQTQALSAAYTACLGYHRFVRLRPFDCRHFVELFFHRYERARVNQLEKQLEKHVLARDPGRVADEMGPDQSEPVKLKSVCMLFAFTE